MRLVTYVGICTEAGESVYAANDCTEFIVQKAWTGAELHQSDSPFFSLISFHLSTSGRYNRSSNYALSQGIKLALMTLLQH